MTSRRAFLSRLGSSGSLVAAALNSNGLTLMARAAEQVRGRSAAEIAADEDFWREVQLGFTLDRTVINLNNGGVCPSPRVVHEAFKRYLDHANQAPVFNMWQEQEPNLERVRAGTGTRCRLRCRRTRDHAGTQARPSRLPSSAST